MWRGERAGRGKERGKAKREKKERWGEREKRKKEREKRERREGKKGKVEINKERKNCNLVDPASSHMLV